ERAAIEATLAGTLALPMGELAAGHEMRAHLTMSFECRHGRIARQHNFDGLDPW
ncbi:MAG: nuclear transport factor 2 family protein, partial [Proteobacteria bacterium]